VILFFGLKTGVSKERQPESLPRGKEESTGGGGRSQRKLLSSVIPPRKLPEESVGGEEKEGKIDLKPSKGLQKKKRSKGNLDKQKGKNSETPSGDS